MSSSFSSACWAVWRFNFSEFWPFLFPVDRVPPPHLSPFVNNEEEGYVPDYAETIKRLRAAANTEILPMPGAGVEDMEDPQNLLAEGFISRTEAIEAAERKKEVVFLVINFQLLNRLHNMHTICLSFNQT